MSGRGSPAEGTGHDPLRRPQPEEGAVICADGVTKSYHLKNRKTVLAIRDIRLHVRSREFLSIVGPSGCGKSTLLNLLAGLGKPDSGQIAVSGGMGKDGFPTLGYISQSDTLLPWRNVRENVEIGLELRGRPKNERRETAERLMAQVGLTGFEKSYPFELSGGMRKRAAVIRTLAYDPDIIFMDEPFVGLDAQTRDALEEDILLLWQKHRKTIVLVTHDLAEAITLSDRVVLLTARPATVKAQYDIPLPRPRSVVETRFTPQFVALQKTIWADLGDEVRRAVAGIGHE